MTQHRSGDELHKGHLDAYRHCIITDVGLKVQGVCQHTQSLSCSKTVSQQHFTPTSAEEAAENTLLPCAVKDRFKDVCGTSGTF